MTTAKTEERSSAQQLTIQIPEELRDQIEAWREEHGEIVAAPVMHAGKLLDLVICRPPKQAELDRLGDGRFDEKKSKTALLRAFVRECLLHPSFESWDGLVAKKPGIVAAIAAQLQTVAGSDTQVLILGN